MVGQAHDVEDLQLGEGDDEHGRDHGEVLGQVVGDRERRQRAAGHQELLADLDDLDELGGVAVEVDHVAGLLGGLGARVHRDADVGLGQCGGVVGAVAHHGDELAAVLLLADVGELGLGGGLGDEVVDAGLVGDRLGGQRVVAGDHDDAQAHLPEPGEPLLDSRLEDVLELDDAEDPVVLGDGQRRGAAGGDGVDGRLVALGDRAALLEDVLGDGVGRTLAEPRCRRGG